MSLVPAPPSPMVWVVASQAETQGPGAPQGPAPEEIAAPDAFPGLPGQPAAPVLPPRPNLGPEPWPEPALSPGTAVAGGSVVLALVVAAALLIRRRRRFRAKAAARPPEPEPSHDGPATPAERLLRASGTVRRAIATRFGPVWDAKTTEELAQAAALPEWLGADRAAEVVALLARSDRAKFARPGADEPDEAQSLAWESLAAAVRAAAAPAPGTAPAGATSIRNGR